MVFTLNEQMDNRTKFDTVDNQVMFSFYFSFQLFAVLVVSHCYETVLVEGYSYKTLAVSNFRSHHLILLPELLCICYFFIVNSCSSN